MSASYVPFCSPTSRRPLERVLARLLGFWDACNMKKRGELMSIDMLLIDDKEITMQGSIPVQVLTMFKSMLHEGSVYAISGFEVTKSNNRFKLTNFHLSIRYCVELVVNDRSNTYAFIAFDKDNEKLTRMHADHLATEIVCTKPI